MSTCERCDKPTDYNSCLVATTPPHEILCSGCAETLLNKTTTGKVSDEQLIEVYRNERSNRRATQNS